MTLADKIRKARQTSIEVGGFKLTIRRPTDIEAVEMNYKDTPIGEVIGDVSKFVIGWDGVKESDLISGGTPDAVSFDAETFGEWIKDKPDMWEPLATGVLDAYKAHKKRMEEQGNA